MADYADDTEEAQNGFILDPPITPEEAELYWQNMERHTPPVVMDECLC